VDKLLRPTHGGLRGCRALAAKIPKKKRTTQNLPLPDYKGYPWYQGWLVGVSSQALFHQNHYRNCAHTLQTQSTTIQ